IELDRLNGDRFEGHIDFSMIFEPDTERLGLTFEKAVDKKEGEMALSADVIVAIEDACNDPDFQKYALVALKKKRRNPKLDLVLNFKNGFVDPKESYVQD